MSRDFLVYSALLALLAGGVGHVIGDFRARRRLGVAIRALSLEVSSLSIRAHVATCELAAREPRRTM